MGTLYNRVLPCVAATRRVQGSKQIFKLIQSPARSPPPYVRINTSRTEAGLKEVVIGRGQPSARPTAGSSCVLSLAKVSASDSNTWGVDGSNLRG